jgi:hypothetical protein
MTGSAWGIVAVFSIDEAANQLVGLVGKTAAELGNSGRTRYR